MAERLISKPVTIGFFLVLGFSFFSLFIRGVSAAQNDWLTWGYDQGRTGWNTAETKLNKNNVSHLELKWKSQLPTAPQDVVVSTLTSPLVASINGQQGSKTLVFVVGSDNTVYAIDSDTGKLSWKKEFPNSLTPKAPATIQCPNTQNATPVIDKDAGIIYVLTSDGKLRGLNLSDGAERMPPTDFTPPFARDWSLNLIDGVIYTGGGRGCGGQMAHFSALDLKDPSRHVAEFYTSDHPRTNGSWGRAGLIRGPNGIYTQTADGPYDQAGGEFGESVMFMSLKDLRLIGNYTASNWEYLNEKDLDLGSSSPMIFSYQKWLLLASAGKEAVISLLDANNLGGADHHTVLYQTPRLGNDDARPMDFGIWGAMATWQDPQEKRWLFVPMEGGLSNNAPKFEHSYGNTPGGSIMAFEVRLDPDKIAPMLAPIWISRDVHAPDAPVVANGVVYALQTGKSSTESRKTGKVGAVPDINAVLFAFDAQTGQQLYSSEKLIDGWAHFSEPVVVGGNIYISTWDGRVYAFGLR